MKFHSTKIIATLGPASSKKGAIKKLILAGVNAFRINTAHGSLQEYSSLVSLVRSVSAQTPVIIDLKGPELRLKTKTTMQIEKGSEIWAGFSRKDNLYFDKDFYKKVSEGTKMLFEDGKYCARVVKKRAGKILLKFALPAVLRHNKGVNIPGEELGLASLSKKDLKVLEWARKKRLSFFALSFARSGKDVKALRKKAGNDCVIISKIESRQGVENFSGILAESDGIIVARGDLGAEVRRESIPLLQKKMIRQCLEAGKFSVVATQMLESMISSDTPTRAEINDIANSVLDGADCLMLSGETAIGINPVAAAKEMRRSCEAVENGVVNKVSMNLGDGVSDSITKSIHQLASYLKVDKIVAFTRSGYTAKMISRFRGKIPVVGACWDKRTARILGLHFGVFPFLLPRGIGVRSKKALSLLKKNGLLAKGDVVIVTGNVQEGEEKHANLIEVQKI
ncbi:MAG: pyruvate kinase [archaeon]|nr:pyruvate kinase [archaeon]